MAFISPVNDPALDGGPIMDTRPQHPIAVDLDNTLLCTDTLHESLVGVVKSCGFRALSLVRALFHGKAAFKRDVTSMIALDPVGLPYDKALLEFLVTQKKKGRKLGLITAADQSIADAVAMHLDLFDVARGSDGIINLSGEAKLAAIQAAFGPHFAYAGDSKVDRPIFSAAESVILAGPVDRLKGLLPSGKPIEAVFPRRSAGIRIWAKALRIVHWSKNVLVFVGPILGFQILNASMLLSAITLFILLGLLASATYIINDLFDLAADRAHHHKRRRPFASGAIPISHGIFGACALVSLSFAFGFALLPIAAAFALVAYFVLTLAYSFILKTQPIADIIVLAGLFTIRILAGSLLIPGQISPWLLTFSMFFFLGLATIKRYAELERVVRAGGMKIVSRGYTAQDTPLLLIIGVGSAFSAIVIFMIYLINEQYPSHLYVHPSLLWAVMPILLLWTLRIWHLAVHGLMDEDPVVFAFRDRLSLFLGGCIAALLVAAWL
jgi:4-hydroxybenzoate polyprenyltransferase